VREDWIVSEAKPKNIHDVGICLLLFLLKLIYVKTELLMLLLHEPKKRWFVPHPVRCGIQSSEDSRRVLMLVNGSEEQMKQVPIPSGVTRRR
jgi:hypothetical protein